MKQLYGYVLSAFFAVPVLAQTHIFTLYHASNYAVAADECVLRFIVSKAAETEAGHYRAVKIPITLFNQAGKVLAEQLLVIDDWQVSPLAPEYDVSMAIDAACSQPHMLKLGRVTAAVEGVDREITLYAADFMPVIIK